MPTRRAPLPPPLPETVLLAVTGLTPGVLTSTVWALANPAEGEPVIPDRVRVFTTVRGREVLERDVLESGLWGELRRQILKGEAERDRRLRLDRVEVFTRPQADGGPVQLEEVSSREEHEAMADCLLGALWEPTGNPDTRVIASIAGGYKTMSALLFSCMTLLGRAHHRVTHVLVQPPYDGGTLDPLYWPGQPCRHLQRKDGKGTVPAADARLVLADVPFVPLRNLFEKDMEKWRTLSSYTRLADHCAGRVLQMARSPVKLSWEDTAGTLRCGTASAVLRGRRAHPLMDWLWTRALAGLAPFPDHIAAEDAFPEFARAWQKRHPAHRRMDHQTGKPWYESLSAGWLRGAKLDLRRSLEKLGAAHALVSIGREVGLVREALDLPD